MIQEAGLVIAFFLGMLVAHYMRDRKPKTYLIKEFNRIKVR